MGIILRITNKIIFFATFLSLAFSADQPKSLKATKTWVDKKGPIIIKDFVKLLSVPNVASDKVNIRKNAEYISSLFEKRNFEMQLLELDGANPIIFGELKTPGAKRTLCAFSRVLGNVAGRGSMGWGERGEGKPSP